MNMQVMIPPGTYCGALKEVQDEGDGAAVDANKQVDTRQRDVGGAGDTEDIGHGVHHGGHRPARTEINTKIQLSYLIDEYSSLMIITVLTHKA